MKKYAPSLLLMIVGLLLSACNIEGMQKPDRWKGRVVLMAQNPATGQWGVLLAHNARGPNVWSDFSEVSHPGERGNAPASRALNAQTNGVYNIPIGHVPHYHQASPAGDIFHFVRVGMGGVAPFRVGQDLYTNARNAIKDDFFWVDANNIINRNPIIHPRRGQIMISPGVYDFLRQHLPGAIAFFGQAPAPAPMPTPAPAPTPKAGAATHWGPHLPNHIYFYNSGQPYYEFTNFYASPVNINGKMWPTTEHYFQAQKYPTNPALQEQIRHAATPRQAFEITRNPAHDRFKDPNWDTNKYHVMLTAIRAKFNQHGNLRTLLLNTGNSVLVENAGANDAVWGAGRTYRGCNHLGQILMQVRAELRGAAQQPYNPPQNCNPNDR